MSSESSSDGTHDSASFSPEGSEISSIPSLTELGRAAAASASESDSDSNPFGELQEADSASETTEASTGDEDTDDASVDRSSPSGFRSLPSDSYSDTDSDDSSCPSVDWCP